MDLLDMKMEIEGNVLFSMYEYIDDNEDMPYTECDVKRCGEILDEFIESLERVKGDEAKILQCVKETVEKLNKLNECVNEELIETEQREDLCCFIMKAVNRAGLEVEEDITEEWREW